jgi:hypothetical protein
MDGLIDLLRRPVIRGDVFNLQIVATMKAKASGEFIPSMSKILRLSPNLES